MSDNRASSRGSSDPVREFLRHRGAAEHLISGGLQGMLDRWEAVVAEVERGYAFDLDNYRNDMDLRQLLDEAAAVASHEDRKNALARIAAADQRLRLHLSPAGRCIWGDVAAARNGWNRLQNWWYFEKPVQ